MVPVYFEMPAVYRLLRTNKTTKTRQKTERFTRLNNAWNNKRGLNWTVDANVKTRDIRGIMRVHTPKNEKIYCGRALSQQFDFFILTSRVLVIYDTSQHRCLISRQISQFLSAALKILVQKYIFLVIKKIKI